MQCVPKKKKKKNCLRQTNPRIDPKKIKFLEKKVSTKMHLMSQEIAQPKST